MKEPNPKFADQLLMGGFEPLQISIGLAVAGILFFAGLLYWGSRFKTLRRTTIILYGLGGGALLVIAAVAINHSAALPGWTIFALAIPAVAGLFVLAGATPAAIGLLADVTEAYPDDRGAIMGLYSVFLGLGQIGGSLIAGVAATALGPRWHLRGIAGAAARGRRPARLPAPPRALPGRPRRPRRRSTDPVGDPSIVRVDACQPCAILRGTGDAPRSHEAVTGFPSLAPESPRP